MSDPNLRQRCHTILPGHRVPAPADYFHEMALWCREHHVAHDTYGEGELLQSFERKVADVLGFEAGVFCITGTMTQVTALRLACMERGSDLVALHPTCHILTYERSNYQLLEHFKALQAGDLHRPWTRDDLANIPDRLGAALVELPMRELGGQLTDWDELEAIKRHCRDRNIHLHMDGARVLEAGAGYGKSYREIAAGFDSAYVSLYKGVGGLGGAMLLGTRELIARAAEWMRRQGGNVVHRSPYVVAAAMQFDARVAAMPAYFARTQWLYDELRAHPHIALNPAAPQSNMLHLHLPVSRARALEIRDRIAGEHGVWLFARAANAALPDRSVVEWYVGDNLLNLPDERVREILGWLADAVK